MPTLPKFELPFDLPKFDRPKVDLPDLPDLPSAQQVLAVVRDAAYAGTGLVALTAERVAELQATFIGAITTQIAAIVQPVASTAKAAVTR